MLGSLLQGIEVVDGRFAGDNFDWPFPFSSFCGIGVLVTYAMLGCGWQILKVEVELQEKMPALMLSLVAVLFAATVVVSLWTVIGLPAIAQHWFGNGNFIWFMPAPILVVACIWGIFRAIRTKREALSFVLALGICILGYTGFVISIWPNIVLPSLTIWGASSSRLSQLFSLVGTIILLPMILFYNAISRVQRKGCHRRYAWKFGPEEHALTK